VRLGVNQEKAAMPMSRRAFLSYATLLGFPRILIDTAAALAQGGPVRVRQNIQQFAQDPQKVAALRAGVGKMKARSQASRDDPLGWFYWAAVHGTPDDPGSLQDIYNQCEHTPFQQIPFQPRFIAEHFISWHRPFLFFFEATLKRAAQEAGVTTAFELPYWNWYADGNMPTIFTEGDETTNPLKHARENEALDSSALDQSAFAQSDLLPPSIPEWRQSFAVPFELDPHGAVHDLIGRDMGNIQTSAIDPIFWLHHANIDRLWTVWSKVAGHNNPAPASTWAQRVFKYDQAGQLTQTAGAVVDSQASLNYRYDDEAPLPGGPVAPVAGPMAQVQGSPPTAAAAPAATSTSATATVSSTSSLSLGSRSVAVDLSLPPAAQTQLHTFAASSTPSGSGGVTGAWLVLENVEIGPDGRNGGFSFSIKAMLPDGSRQVKLGQLGTFTWPSATSAQGAHDHGRAPIALTIPLKDVLGQLGVSNPADLAKGLRVVFEAAHREKAGSPTPQFIKIGSISIKTTTAPAK
jgi:tyrosinase